MATCPKCMGALTEDHRCPRSWPSQILTAVSMVAIGGGLGTLLCFVVDDQPSGALVFTAAALGTVIVRAVWQAVKS